MTDKVDEVMDELNDMLNRTVMGFVEKRDCEVGPVAPDEIEACALRIENAGLARAEAMRKNADVLLESVQVFHARVHAYADKAVADAERTAAAARAQGIRAARLEAEVNEAFESYNRNLAAASRLQQEEQGHERRSDDH